MRRDWTSVPLFALALVIQTTALAAMNVVMKRASGADRSSIEFCLQQASGGGEQRRSPGRGQDHHDSCPICQVCCDGLAPYEARLQNIGMAPVQSAGLAWTVADRALPAPRRDSARQPRAPPAFS
jgi:hypothetical protein